MDELRAEAARARIREEVDMDDVPPSPIPPEAICEHEDPHTNASHEHPELGATRSGRKRKVPKRYQDFVPSSLSGLTADISLLAPPPPASHLPPSSVPSTDIPLVEDDRISFAERPELQHLLHVTGPSDYGLYRCYPVRPVFDPEDQVGSTELCDAPGLDAATTEPPANPLQGFGTHASLEDTQPQGDSKPWYHPFANPSIARIVGFKYRTSMQKSNGEMNYLVHGVIKAHDFDVAHFDNFTTIEREEERLDKHTDSFSMFSEQDGWRRGSVKLSLPKENTTYQSHEEIPQFEVEGLWYRPLLGVIKAAYTDTSQTTFHMIPFRLFHDTSDLEPSLETPQPGPSQPPNTHDVFSNEKVPPHMERVYSEMYTADAMLEEDAKIRAMPRNPSDGPEVEYALAPLLASSDSTRLANFGPQKLWPVYIFFAAVSKYVRCMPTSFAAHHLAYLPSLPDVLQDHYRAIYGVSATAAVLRLCRSELMHAIWLLLLDEDFMKAYEHGILILCADGVLRRLFPRFFSYSADYPERVMLACIRFLAKCPCPTCYTTKDDIPGLGTKRDQERRSNVRVDTHAIRTDIARAAKLIFEKGVSAASAGIKRLLDPLSLLPTRSAFSIRLEPFNFNFYSLFTPDLMHEFELGVWKALFIHLLRVLYALGGDKIQHLNVRFREVPTFGRDTIRRFHSNVSGLKKLAARDYEDILQCAIPCFDGLIPGRLGELTLDILFIYACWHALAKLRIHTETTVQILEFYTTLLGSFARRFARECKSLDTQELPNEEAARGRRELALAVNGKGSSVKISGQGAKTKRKTKRRKNFNLKTFKHHDLGHFGPSIRRVGTTENYSTEMTELEHRRAKRFWPLSKTRDMTQTMTKHQQNERIMHNIMSHEAKRRTQIYNPSANRAQTKSATPCKAGRPRKIGRASRPWTKQPLHQSHPASLLLPETLPATPFKEHHQISTETRLNYDLIRWLHERAEDPAYEHFLPQLQDHLIGHLVPTRMERLATDEERMGLQIYNNKIYFHQTMRINYTTYDMRRDQDTINPCSHPDVMVLASNDDDGDHPYWYARAELVFHVRVRYTGPGSTAVTREFQNIHVVWVRWYKLDISAPGGFATRRLHRVRFYGPSEATEDAFGFVNPAEVIRGVHLIPAFAHGRTQEYLGPSSIRDEDELNEDWRYFYVNMFVDRDMFMRYLGGGIGHKMLRGIVRILDTVQILVKQGFKYRKIDSAEEQPDSETTSETETADAESARGTSDENSDCGTGEEGSNEETAEEDDEEFEEMLEYLYMDPSDSEEGVSEEEEGGNLEEGDAEDEDEGEEGGGEDDEVEGFENELLDDGWDGDSEE